MHSTSCRSVLVNNKHSHHSEWHRQRECKWYARRTTIHRITRQTADFLKPEKQKTKTNRKHAAVPAIVCARTHAWMFVCASAIAVSFMASAFDITKPWMDCHTRSSEYYQRRECADCRVSKCRSFVRLSFRQFICSDYTPHMHISMWCALPANESNQNNYLSAVATTAYHLHRYTAAWLLHIFFPLNIFVIWMLGDLTFHSERLYSHAGTHTHTSTNPFSVRALQVQQLRHFLCKELSLNAFTILTKKGSRNWAFAGMHFAFVVDARDVLCVWIEWPFSFELRRIRVRSTFNGVGRAGGSHWNIPLC